MTRKDYIGFLVAAPIGILIGLSAFHLFIIRFLKVNIQNGIEIGVFLLLFFQYLYLAIMLRKGIIKAGATKVEKKNYAIDKKMSLFYNILNPDEFTYNAIKAMFYVLMPAISLTGIILSHFINPIISNLLSIVCLVVVIVLRVIVGVRRDVLSSRE